MSMNDPIADMLTRVRNANRMKFRSVNAQLSRVNLEIVKVLKRTGYISGFAGSRSLLSSYQRAVRATPSSRPTAGA